jgi:hypothetical protein
VVSWTAAQQVQDRHYRKLVVIDIETLGRNKSDVMEVHFAFNGLGQLTN